MTIKLNGYCGCQMFEPSKSLILYHSVIMCHIILTINSRCFPKEHYPVEFFDGCAMFFCDVGTEFLCYGV